MNREEIDILLNKAEHAAIKGDHDAFKEVFPNVGNNPLPAYWYGTDCNIPWCKISVQYPHIRYLFLKEHHFDSWEKFTEYIQSLDNSESTDTQFELAAQAIISGDITTLQELVQKNPSLIAARSRRSHRATLLHYVGANGIEWYRQKTPANIIAIAELLLQAGADINAVADMYSKDTTIGLVATSFHPYKAGVQNELLEFLLNNGAVMHALPGENLITACLANGRQYAAEFLAGKGAEINLEGAAGLGLLNKVKSFFNEDKSLPHNISVRHLQNGFCWACEYNRPAIVEFLLTRGIDAGTQQKGLHWAAIAGHTEIIQIFLDRKAPLETRNEYGGTVLGAALWGAYNNGERKDFKPVVQMLIDEGADVNVGDLKQYADKVLSGKL